MAAAAWYYSDSILAFADSILPSSGTVSESANQPVTESSVPKIPSENTQAAANDGGSGQNPIPAQQYSPIERRIQLEILNGCGEKGIAGKLANILKDSRYDIVNSGNYMERGNINWEVKETRIIDQVGKVENARDLADVMGVLYSNVESYNNPSPIADITIIIGEDYKTLPIFQ